MKVSELEGEALDYWVAKAMGFTHTSASEAAFALDGQTEPCVVTTSSGKLRLAKADSVTAWNPSTDWAIGGPLIEREEIMTCKDGLDVWGAMCGGVWHPNDESSLQQGGYQGPTLLIAAMRAIVASKFGEEVEDAPSATG